MPLLELENVHSYYGHIHALKGISLVVEEGEVVTLIGANGAGKSTTLRTISGLMHAREGSIHLNGKDITRMPPHEIVVIGVGHVPEGRGIFPRLTVRENLEMGAYTVTNHGRNQPAHGRGFLAVPPPAGAHGPERRHAFGRRAADAGDRARADA